MAHSVNNAELLTISGENDTVTGIWLAGIEEFNRGGGGGRGGRGGESESRKIRRIKEVE